MFAQTNSLDYFARQVGRSDFIEQHNYDTNLLLFINLQEYTIDKTLAYYSLTNTKKITNKLIRQQV